MDIDSDVVRTLREATRTRHETIERVMPFSHADFSVKTYVQVLKAFLGFFEPLEARICSLDQWESAGIDLPRRLRSDLLRRDLHYLGLDDTAVDTLPRCTDLFPITRLDSGLGVLYVLEGSTLGGKVIASDLASRFGLAPSSGILFFSSGGRDVVSDWRSLCGALRNNLVGLEARENAVNAATLTFDRLEQWMSSQLHWPR